MNLYEETRFIMKQNNITANKNLGQNFLINEDVVDSIVENAEITALPTGLLLCGGIGTFDLAFVFT